MKKFIIYSITLFLIYLINPTLFENIKPKINDETISQKEEESIKKITNILNNSSIHNNSQLFNDNNNKDNEKKLLEKNILKNFTIIDNNNNNNNNLSLNKNLKNLINETQHSKKIEDQKETIKKKLSQTKNNTVNKENNEAKSKFQDVKENKTKNQLVITTSMPESKNNGQPPTSTPKILLTTETVKVHDKFNNHCIVPAIEQFPRPVIGPSGRKHGGLIIYILFAIYTFLGLAIVCDEYFVASLDRICEELKMSPDVAGATFMAAGSSAPELATVIIGVFFAKDDIGISGVIGSAVFNIMFVISICALCTSVVVYLNWWPLIRDSTFYAISILVMLITIQDEMISWIESVFMLVMYVVYCLVLHFNEPLEQWANTLPIPFKKVAPHEESGLVNYKTLQDGKRNSYGSPIEQPDQNIDNQLSGPDLNQATNNAQAASQTQSYYRPKEYNPATFINPLEKPTEGGPYKQFTWALVYPIHYLCRKTVPDCRSEQYRNWYPLTFVSSMIWISFYSYFMVWMITVIGSTLGIPDTVMGLTFVAAGVSVPDALSSIAVIREGYGDMAVSNAVGSNVFDILICLGLPWFIKTAIIKPGSQVKVISKGLTYSTLSLLSTVIFLVVAIHMNSWRLDKKFGIILMVWYLIFITLASMYELNVFGYLNPPECKSDY